MGQVALELARLHPAGLHESDQAAYEARFARVRRRHKRRDDQKAAARVLPPLDSSARNLYRSRSPSLNSGSAPSATPPTLGGRGRLLPGAHAPRPAVDSVASSPVRITLPLHRHTAVQPALW